MSKHEETIGNEEIIAILEEDGINVPPTLEDYEQYNVIPPKKLYEHGIRPQDRIYILKYRDKIEQLKTRPTTKREKYEAHNKVLKYIEEVGEIRTIEFEKVGLNNKQRLYTVLKWLKKEGQVEKVEISHKNVIYRIPVNE
ncbi:hypothetical protein [Candidatus Borrarchaeum sp.]|uniref:hypothetical protein n=1 Tax=Candidatus Borrarchaeum sp. TaxID=2846742 RepID=UPI00257C15D1|nr:hypothetical protein [Candidatus Borrarchaeum sp.]